MPAIDTGGAKLPRRRRRRPAPRPQSTAPPRQADQGDRTRALPAPRPTAPVRPAPGSAPAFRPIGSQSRPLGVQQRRAHQQVHRTDPAPPAHAPYRPAGPRVDASVRAQRIANSPAFRPISSQAAPLRVQESQQARQARQARNRLPDHPAIPEVNGLYLQSDLNKLDDLYKRARLKAANAKTPAEFRKVQREYEREHKAAVAKLESTPPQELIGRIRAAYRAGAEKVGGTSITDLYQYGSLRQRRQMKQVSRTINGYEQSIAEQTAAARGIPVGQDTVKAGKRPTLIAGIPVEGALHAATTFADARTRIPGHSSASLEDIASIPYQLARATYEDPSGVAHSSVRTGLESIGGIPEGFKKLFTDPKGAGAGMLKDYEQRYGPILNDPAEFRRRVKQDSGLTPFVLDAATLGVPVGRFATILARSGAAGRAVAALARVADENGKLRPLSDFAGSTHRAARAPRDAKRLANLNSQIDLARLEGDTVRVKQLEKQIKDAEANVKATERPALRFSAGEAGVRKQASSPNLFIGVGQRGIDRARRRAFEGTVKGAGWLPGPGGRLIEPRAAEISLQARVDAIENRLTGMRPGTDVYKALAKEANDLHDKISQAREAQLTRPARIQALRPGDNEVLPKTTGFAGRSVRELPGLRRYTGRIARDLGGAQSTTRIKLLTHRGRVIHSIDKALKRLDPEESAAMKYMLQLGATADHAGVKILEDRRAQIMAARAAHKTRIASVLEDSNDELKLIDRILSDPAKHLTPRAREVADELRAIQLSEARRDPELTAGQELIRRMTPQGKALGVERGPDVQFFRDVLGEIEHRTGVAGVAAHADELAAMHPSARAARAKELRDEVGKQRKAAEARVETARRRLAAAQARVDQAEKRGIPLTTDEMRQASQELARAKRTVRRLSAQLPKAERRRGLVTGRLSERNERGAPLPTPEVREARQAVSQAQRRLNVLERKLPGRSRTEGRRIGEATGRETPGRNTRAFNAQYRTEEVERAIVAARKDLRDAQTNLAAVERDAPRITPIQHQGMVETGTSTEGLHGQLSDAENAARDARARLDQATAAAPRVTDVEARNLRMRDRELAAARTTRDHVRDFEKALKKVVTASKSKSNMRLEDADEFAARVKDAADSAGLAAPAYWWSAARPEDLPSLAAAGRGLRAAHGNKRYKGALFDIGAEEHGIDRFTQGVERNIKRRFQQALVAGNLETHAYEWSKGVHGAGLTLKDIKRAMDERAIDPRSVELVDPRVLRRRTSELEGVERGQTLGEQELEAARNRLGREPTADDFISTTQQDLADARRRWSEVTHADLQHQAQHRYLVVPREVSETIDGVASKMDNTFWRGMEVVLKQKPARILLGAANVPWLAFQVASNALLTGFGGSVNPWNVVGAHKWWKGLTADEREAVEAELGVTHGHHFGMDQPNLGATTSRTVNFWRAYKKTRVGRLAHKANPLDLMFRADEAQNNFFRKVLFYDRSRKAAYRRMGHSWKGIDTATTRLVDRVLARPPLQQAHLIAQHGADFEKVAKHVNDFLGDYMRFTPSERFLLSRNIMFYGYLRYSLRFAFYTMPIAHPIMANILSNVGRMGAQEIKKLMGVPANYNLPTSMLANVYFGSRDDAKHNELRSLPLGRFNPFLNAVTQLDGLQQAFGLVSPFYQVLADQAFEESSFTGRDWRIGGRPTPSESDRPKNYFGSAANLLNPLAYDFPGHEGRPRNRIAENALLNLAYPYRVATKTGIPGIVNPLEPNQSDDTLLWRPQPMTYADPGATKGVKQSREEFHKEGPLRHLGSALLPVFPERTSAPAVVARELEREDAIRARNKRKPGARKRRRSTAKKKASYATGSGGASPYSKRRRKARYR